MGRLPAISGLLEARRVGYAAGMVHRQKIAAVGLGGIMAAGLLAGLGCTSSESAGGGGGGGMHLPRPGFHAARATLPPLAGPASTSDIVGVEFLASNATGAPLWLREMSLTLSAGESTLAAGEWEGDRQIDPGTSLLLDVSLPMLDRASVLPGLGQGGDVDGGTLTVRARYARSGLIGLMGGESHTYTLPVTFQPASVPAGAGR